MDAEEKVIEAVRAFPCLWKVKSKSYKDQTAKENAWKEVSKQVNEDMAECQRKWRLLRDKYVRELRKDKSARSGDAGPPYESCWPLYKLLGFLESVVQHRKTDTNIPPSESFVQEELSEIEGNALHDSPSTSMSNNSIIVSPSPPQLDDDDSSQPPVKKKRSCDEFDDALIRHLQEKAEARKKRQEVTEDDHFSRHVAGVLKRLPSRAKAIARLRIEQVLLDVEFPEPQSFQTPYNFPS